jgi:hypothetical protein
MWYAGLPGCQRELDGGIFLQTFFEHRIGEEIAHEGFRIGRLCERHFRLAHDAAHFSLHFVLERLIVPDYSRIGTDLLVDAVLFVFAFGNGEVLLARCQQAEARKKYSTVNRF